MEDDEVASDQYNDANQADNPMHAVSGRPTEHEVSDGQSDNTEKGRYETVFWCPEPRSFYVRNQVLVLVDQKDGDSDCTCDADGDKGEACFAQIEAIDWRVD